MLHIGEHFRLGFLPSFGSTAVGYVGEAEPDGRMSFFSLCNYVCTHCQRLYRMVQDYLGARADLDTFPAGDPLAYWVLRLDHWPELSQYAMQLLGCPSSSVLSERTCSAAGGFVTDKRVRLSTDSVDLLTFTGLFKEIELLEKGNRMLKISVRFPFLAIRVSREQAIRQILVNCLHIRCLFGPCSRAVKSP